MEKTQNFLITWEVCWTPDDSEEERTEYTETLEVFDEDDGVESVEDFLEVSESINIWKRVATSILSM